MFKHLALIATLALMGCGSSPKSQKPRLSGQIISIDKAHTDTVRFGVMGSGEVAVKHLRFVNNTGQSVVIANYDTTCGCTTLSYPSHPIAPGDTVGLNLEFNSQGLYGWQLKQLTMQLSGYDKPLKVIVEAQVE